MSKGNGPLDFEATLDTAKFNYMLDVMESRIKGATNTAVKEADRMDKSFNKASLMIGGYFAATFGQKMVTDMIRVRGEFQQLEIAFETMLKNKALSDQLMSDVVMFAAKTPFDLKGVATGAKQLLAYGEEAKDIIPTMTRLGDVASGLSIPFGDLVYLYGTSRTQGKLMTKDLMQFAGRGIPIIEELSKVLRVSKAEVLEMASKSMISFSHLETVIKNLTNETGMFGGMMAKQAGSLTGLVSNLGDAWDRMLNKMGEQNQEGFASSIKLATELVENYEDVLNIMKTIIATYGAYRAMIIMNAVALKGYSEALNLVIIKQKLLNLAQKASPLGLALTGLTALIGAMYTYRQAMGNTVSLQQQINTETSKEIVSLNSLFTSLKNAKEGTDKRNDAIKIANDRYGKYLENLLTEKSTLIDIEAAQKRVTNALIADISVKQSKAKLEETLGAISEQFDSSFSSYLESFSNTYGADRIGEFITSINDAVDKEIAARGGKVERGTLEYSKLAKGVYDDFVSSISQKTGFLKLNFKEFQDDFLDFAETKAENLPAIEQMQAMISSFQGIVDGFSNVQKTDIPDTILDKKTFAEKLEQTKKQFDNYYKWIERYGKEAADNTFAKLVKGGDSFLEYLYAEIEKIEKKSTKSATDNQNLSTLLFAKDELLGNKTQLENLQEYIEKTKEGYSDLVDYIGYLKDEIASFENDGSETAYQSIIFMQKALNDAEAEFIKNSTETYNALQQQSQDFGNRRLVIEKQFQDTIKKLDKETLGAKYDEAVKIAEEIRKKNIDELEKEQIQNNAGYKKLLEDINKYSRRELKKSREDLLKILNTLDPTSESYKHILDLIKAINNELLNRTVKTLGDIESGFTGIANIVGDFDATLSNSLELAGNLAGAMSKIASGNVIGGGVQLFGSVFSYLSERDKAKQQKDDEADQSRLEITKKLIDSMNSSLEVQIKLLEELVGTDKMSQYAETLSKLAINISSTVAQMEALDELVIRNSNGRLQKYRVDIPDVDLDISDLDTYGRITKLNEGIKILEDSMNSLNSKIESGKIDGDDIEALQAYIDAYKQDIDSLKELQHTFFAEVTGTTYDSILDGLENAFLEGLTSAEYFATSFEDMMRKALLQSLSINALQGPINDWYDAFAQATGDGVLTKEEIAQLRQSMSQIYEDSAEYAKMLEEAAGISLSNKDQESQDKLASAVKGVTEQTAGLIAGYMNAIRINQAQSLSVMNRKLEVLNRIEGNTRFSRLIYEYLLANPANNSLSSTRING